MLIIGKGVRSFVLHICGINGYNRFFYRFALCALVRVLNRHGLDFGAHKRAVEIVAKMYSRYCSGAMCYLQGWDNA